MKKILFIIWSYSLGGGAESLLTTIVNHLSPTKYQVGIIEIYRSGVKKELVNPNVIIYDSITFEGDPEYEKKLYYIYREPERMIKRYIPSGYDLYVSFNYQTPSFLLPKRSRNIAWVHTSIYDLAEKGMEDYQYLQNKAFDRAWKLVSISDITTKSLRDLCPMHSDKIVEIYNGINIKEVREKSESVTHNILRRPAVIFVGRLDERKNPLRMVDVFSDVFKKNSSVHLYFLGEGRMKAQVLERAREYGIEEQVHILGYLENPFPVIKQADVCCMTSESEGFPMSLLESVALHVPFVSTAVGGAAVLANEERCGRIYTTDDEAVMHILEFLNMPRSLIKKECQESIVRFDFDVYISKIEQLFDEALRQEIVASYREEERQRIDLAWDNREVWKPLEDRKYYYHFPDGFLSKGSKVVLYGAGDIGTNYYHYIKETGDYQIVAWVDAAAEKYRNLGKDVWEIDMILDLKYDVILVAVMHESVAQSIRISLCGKGIPEERIVWVPPVF